jgi:hypothetical protein
MKSPTTLLAERAVAKQPHVEDPLAPLREAAREHVDAPVIDACTFNRRWSYGAQFVADRLGFIFTLLYRKRAQMQAGGLPSHFLLVVTPEEVVALEQRQTVRSGSTMAIRGEVARWRREDLTVEVEPGGGYLTNVTLTSAREGETVKCCVGKADVSTDFIALLNDPARQTPARA